MVSIIIQKEEKTWNSKKLHESLVPDNYKFIDFKFTNTNNM